MNNERPDDYFNNGVFEIARFGKHNIIKNNMTAEQHKKFVNVLTKKYPQRKKKIDKLVKKIRKHVSKCDPIQLLSFSSDMFLVNNLGITSEIQSSQREIYASRMTEYIQSILVSTQVKPKQRKKDPSRYFFKIKNEIERLYELIETFYHSWAANTENFYPDYSAEERALVIEAQTLYLVRGHRYQVFEIEYFERLLKSHDSIFIETYGISYKEIVDGIRKIQYALSQGKFDAINDIMEIMDNNLKNGYQDIEENKKIRREFIDKFLGTKLRNVIDITDWPVKFVDSLSWSINQCEDFFDTTPFAGWPIIDLPIQKRPFIKIQNDYYCFDYYSFMDNFYRAIQKAIARDVPAYRWSDFQKEASEEMVATVFSQILPGCIVYRDNYYPKNKSLKKLNENDLIISYENIIIIIEVKAGSFVFTAPITDFENHIKSYKNLIEKADHQCKNTYDYITSADNIILYNQDGSIKTQLDMNKVDDIFMISVTMDNINDFAARAEKLNFLDLKCNAISLSIDDLMVYREYFDSPLIFLHFLKQRRQATLERKLSLNDELDHLGMYIEHNMYCLQLKDYPEDAHIIFHGYREALDKYFCGLYHEQNLHEKPSHELPQLFVDFINHLEHSKCEHKVFASNYLLDFSSEAKEQLCQYIAYTLKRQKEIGYMISFSTGGDEFSLKYTAFVEQPSIKSFTEEYKSDYVLSTMLWNDDKERIMLDFTFDSNDNLLGLKAKKFSADSISETECCRLLEQGKQRATLRINTYVKQHGCISEEQNCPCGSGKIYGDCCGIKLKV